ncbi:hypothetical protein [Streptomyces sp. NPDC058335]|uniref:hypothetical protein n=1 Tax=Streptomyces sp. NPDC058335 TaxID=3346451 RepID=UPI00365AD4E1
MDDRYFDAVAQIHVERLTKGRVALLGDTGYGATMGGTARGAWARTSLAGEPAPAGGDRTALAEYETRIRDFARTASRSRATRTRSTPPAERRVRTHDRTYRLLSSRLLADFCKKLTERAATDIRLREYPAA